MSRRGAKSLQRVIDPGLLLAMAFALGLLAIASGSASASLLSALSAAGVYLFCRRRSGSLGAVLASLIYVCSPPLLAVLPYAFEADRAWLVMALFPLLLWRLDALRDRPAAVNLLLAGLSQAALLCTASLMAIFLSAISLGWVTFETFVQAFNREASQMRAMPGLLALLAILLGAGAAGPAWIDSYSEMRLAYGNEAESREAGSQVMRLATLLAPPVPADENATNGVSATGSLGLASWALALAGGISALLLYTFGYRTRHPHAFLGGLYFALLALALMAWAATDDLSGWWILGGLPREALLGPLVASLAIAASMNGFWLERLESRARIVAVAVVCALPIVMAIPLLSRPGLPLSWREAWQAFGFAAPQIATADGAYFASALSILLIGAIAWKIRKPALTPRPYWHVPPLSRTEVAGLVAGALIGLGCCALFG